MIFPEFLQQGDLITIVSPSGAIDGEVLEQAAAAIRRLGYSVKIAEHAKGKHHRFSATDEERLADLQSALDDPHTRVILCGRGGYGLTRIVDRLDFSTLKELTFEQPDTNRFRCLALAYEALNQGGNMACILNAANEVVVSAFLKDRIPFLRMSEVIEQSMVKVPFIQTPTYEDYVATDAEARRIAESLIGL